MSGSMDAAGFSYARYFRAIGERPTRRGRLNDEAGPGGPASRVLLNEGRCPAYGAGAAAIPDKMTIFSGWVALL